MRTSSIHRQRARARSAHYAGLIAATADVETAAPDRVRSPTTAHLQNPGGQTTLPWASHRSTVMARKINRRNFFIFDQLLDAVDRAQDLIDDTTLKKYEDHQDYQSQQKRQEEAQKKVKQEADKLEAIREHMKALSKEVGALLKAVEEVKKRQAEINKLKMDRPF